MLLAHIQLDDDVAGLLLEADFDLVFSSGSAPIVTLSGPSSPVSTVTVSFSSRVIVLLPSSPGVTPKR